MARINPKVLINSTQDDVKPGCVLAGAIRFHQMLIDFFRGSSPIVDIFWPVETSYLKVNQVKYQIYSISYHRQPYETPSRHLELLFLLDLGRVSWKMVSTWIVVREL